MLFEYLMDTCGTDTVMDGFINERSMYRTFGKSYAELYIDCMAYLRETYGELFASLE